MLSNMCSMHVFFVCGLEDKKLLRIVLVKSHRDAANCWRSLLEGQYAADAYVLDQMEKKLTLERFQNEVDTYCMYLYTLLSSQCPCN